MKLSNLFKKATTANAKVQKLEKNQLEKVVGGAELVGVAFGGAAEAGKVNAGLHAAGGALAQ